MHNPIAPQGFLTPYPHGKRPQRRIGRSTRPRWLFTSEKASK
jgi:hypothetical protein